MDMNGTFNLNCSNETISKELGEIRSRLDEMDKTLSIAAGICDSNPKPRDVSALRRVAYSLIIIGSACILLCFAIWFGMVKDAGLSWETVFILVAPVVCGTVLVYSSACLFRELAFRS